MSVSITRPKRERVIAGVAAGIARWLNIDPTLIRILFIVLALAKGIGVVLYIVLWLLMPEEELETPAPVNMNVNLSKEANSEGTKKEATVRINVPSDLTYKERHPHWIDGLILVLVGVWLLIHNLSPFFNQYTPLPGIVAILGFGVLLASVVSQRYGMWRFFISFGLMAGGVLWQLHVMDLLHIQWEELLKYWPTLLIATGLTMILRPKEASPAVFLVILIAVIAITLIITVLIQNFAPSLIPGN
ncbi:MAG: PspC domain-containing protein [Chlorobi bacterium]|nr:PspC domain-containing protein [Chlorobiota bacterium]